MKYQDALDYISSLAPRGWRLGLDRMEEFAKRAGLTGSLGESQPKFIHVAGTNGKGSTTAMLQSCLHEQGFRTGSFFSPYVVDPRERVQFGKSLISENDLAVITEYLKPIGESLADSEFGGVTEFEFKTAIGFEYWKRMQAEWVALEVGLGGRLDATNIITPECSIIVSIGWDHMNILGNSLSEIASEKAGILKPGKPGVVGRMAPKALESIERKAKEVGANLWRMDQEIQIETNGHSVTVSTPGSTAKLEPSLFGEIQLHNAALVYAALECAGAIRNLEQLQQGMRTAFIPGRYQKLVSKDKTFILDGAHNLDSARILSQMLDEEKHGKMLCITGMLTGHEPEPFYEALKDHIDELFIVPIDFHRSRNPHDLAEELRKLGFKTKVFETKEAAIEAAHMVANTDDILITGSFFLVGEITRLLLGRPLL